MIEAMSLDYETYSSCDLKKAGLYKYAQHPSTELLCAAFQLPGTPIDLWIPIAVPDSVLADVRAFMAKNGHGRIWYQFECPQPVVHWIEQGGKVRAHNAQFERRLTNTVAIKHGMPRLEVTQMVCTMAKASAAAIPKSLGEAAKALGTFNKNEIGKGQLHQICKPYGQNKRRTPFTDPERFSAVFCYCIDDVRAEAGIDAALPDLSADEQAVYAFDARLNDRGVMVDLQMIAHAEHLIDQYKAHMEVLCLKETGFKPTQREKLADWIRANGWPQLDDMQAETLRQLIDNPRVPAPVKKVLKIYSTYNMKAVTKFPAMRLAACWDARIYGMFMFHGAATGRWSSLMVQLQNLFRPLIKDADVAIAAFAQRDLDWIRALYSDIDPMKVFASCIRGMIIAPKGKLIQAIDLSSIEARVIAWLADEQWKLDAFRKYDTFLLDADGKKIPDPKKKGDFLRAGPDLYVLAYALAFNVPVESVTEDQRQIGKVMELALGFEGGVGAFVTMVATYNINLQLLAERAYPHIPDDVLQEAERAWAWAVEQGRTLDLPEFIYIVCDALKRLWRRAHPKVVQTWAWISEASIQAVLHPGVVYALPNQKVRFLFDGTWLVMRLPSGRKIRYFKPEVDQKTKTQSRYVRNEYGMYEDQDVEVAVGKPQLVYQGIGTKSRRYGRTGTYGGSTFQSAVQGTARDVMVCGCFELEDFGYLLNMLVHDEAVGEVEEDFDSLDHAIELMVNNKYRRRWAADLPVAAAGFRAPRYRK